MKFSLSSSKKRQIDEVLLINDLFSKEGAAFDFVIAELNGSHPTIINYVSERIYFILSGKAVVVVDETSFDVQENDLIYIMKGQKHSINGSVKYLIITSPPFDPKNEKVIDNE
jgi:mannose-6-phosphate isomerase-like protein (cupin superfamily)